MGILRKQTCGRPFILDINIKAPKKKILSISNIKFALRSTGDREVPALSLGELVMDELKSLDPVAYVRFASVYRDFQDVKDFADVVEKLE